MCYKWIHFDALGVQWRGIYSPRMIRRIADRETGLSPLKPPVYSSTLLYWGVQGGGLNWASIMPRNASEKRYAFIQSWSWCTALCTSWCTLESTALARSLRSTDASKPHQHGQMFSLSCSIKPNLYCNYTFPIDVAPNKIPKKLFDLIKFNKNEFEFKKFRKIFERNF